MSVRLVRAPARRRLPDVDTAALAARARRALEALDLRGAELSVVLADDATMAELNRTWRGLAGPTDVLSFSLLEGAHAERRGRLLGDVVLGVDVARRQTAARGEELDDELARLLVHGLLHLVGHDHERADEARAMRAMERRLWRVLHP